MKRSPLKRFSPLKRKTPLKRGNSQLKRTPLRKQSEKARAEAFIWVAVKRERGKLLIEKFGYLLCERCKRATDVLDGHHNNRNRRINTVENCRLLCRKCHTEVTDNNVKNVEGLL